ncbi:MAG: excinuclease ABC subunit UvrA [Chthoniobacterales bacterium]|nr:excinuclease ABC subunit UvrA [Chthoniobacterales bacterium]
MTSSTWIRLRGVRQNNLQGFDLDLPTQSLIVVTGPSGSGKSSLAFDTIYAEGQRRYVETFSPYTRQFLERMDKPRVTSIEGIPPAIAIEQNNSVKTTRSTVGTITEINDYLKLLMAKGSKAFCPQCHHPIQTESAESIAKKISKIFPKEQFLIVFPVTTGMLEEEEEEVFTFEENTASSTPQEKGPPKERTPSDFFNFLREQGYLRIWIDGKIHRTDEPPTFQNLPPTVFVIQDRLQIDPHSLSRLIESIETALRLGKDRISFISATTGAVHPFSSGWHCAHCDINIRPPTPGLFSFNNPLGACPVCRGFGRVIGFDYNRVIPNRSLSIIDGAIKPFQSGQAREYQQHLLRVCVLQGIDVHHPFENLSPKQQEFIIKGEANAPITHPIKSDAPWCGIEGFFRGLERQTYKMPIRVFLSRYRSYKPCESCHGGRFQPDTLNYYLPLPSKPLTLPEITALPASTLIPLLKTLPVSPDDSGMQMLCDQIISRLGYLDTVGLGYLSLDRPTRSLSGGEIARVNLTTCLGASLVNTLFVMDEPSVGLHPRDVARLLDVMHSLRDKGNTLLVVEHEEAIMRAADHIVDLGPGRGNSGGSLMYSGSLGHLASCKKSLTSSYLRGEKSIPTPKKATKPKEWITMEGITHHNMRNLNVKIPLGVFCCVTGVSGSGKSSLIRDVLYRHLTSATLEEDDAMGFCRSIKGGEYLSDIVMVDQSSLAKTPRSTPAVYMGVFDTIRDIFGMTKEAIETGLTPSAFSFNSGLGRCDRCAGLGFEKIEMQFLSDLFLRCPECDGRRYQQRVLNILYREKSIHDVLEMTAQEAIDFFKDESKAKSILAPLQLLTEVGLDYLKLGQPINLLSGGESQRLKLAARLSAQEPGEALLIFDEPTTGLHIDDIAVLLKVFHRLVQEGNSLIVIEHHLDVIKSADWIIDIGPEPGEAGGKLVVAGTPQQVAKHPTSHTGRYLREVLAGRSPLSITQTPSVRKSSDKAITIHGAREHNLKNINLSIPRNEIVVITGLSGSGKSTLAFDILFAEGQRRFLDSMSPYARQFVQQLEKPDVDQIDGLPPSVAIEQRITRGGGKSTVATVTEIHQFLRLLYAKLGTQYCPDCHVPVEKNSLTAIADRVEQLVVQGPVEIFAPLVRGRKGLHTEVARWAIAQGFTTLLVDGVIVAAEDFKPLKRFQEHTIDVLVETLAQGEIKGILKTVQRSLEVGKGAAKLRQENPNKKAKEKFVTQLLSMEMNCPQCSRSFEELDPRFFSFNSPHGWCEQCRGFGETWIEKTSREFDSQLEAELVEEKSFDHREEGETRLCPACHGKRLNPTASTVQINNLSLPELTAHSAADVFSIIKTWDFTGRDQLIARDIIPEVSQRLSFLSRVGLDYLQLDRSVKTLSGGESQRIRLAAQLGSNLRGVLYVLDEPTIGLHPRDNNRLLDALEELAAHGNSLVIVEHDEETMRRAHSIIDLGPRAGSKGGEIVAQGSIKDIMKSPVSLTGKFLLHPPAHPLKGSRRPLKEVPEWLELKGATKHNLHNIDIAFPLQRLTAISGISGSGKSTLLRGILLPAVEAALALKRKKTGAECWTSLSGTSSLAQVIEVDQSPIGKTSRSTPATYLKIFDIIRNLYAELPLARLRGYTASRFSFNNHGGRCQTCEGQGLIKLEMSFLPTSYMPCEDCYGTRFNRQTLEVRYDGKSISDVLKMTVEQAAEFFTAHPKIRRPLQLLVETGLGYLQLGQPSPTLSGGEAQRIKLVSQLSRGGNAETVKTKKNTLYILEEPTIGLHAADVALLLDVLHRLVDEGNTVIVVEHHLDLIAEADYVIDVGPEAGHEGGKIVATGTPEEVAENKESRTAPFLKEILYHSKTKDSETTKKSKPTKAAAKKSRVKK